MSSVPAEVPFGFEQWERLANRSRSSTLVYKCTSTCVAGAICSLGLKWQALGSGHLQNLRLSEEKYPESSVLVSCVVFLPHPLSVRWEPVAAAGPDPQLVQPGFVLATVGLLRAVT